MPKPQRNLTLINGDSDDDAGDVVRMLRSQLEEIRDRGEAPFVVALVGSNKQLPSILRASMPIVDLTACATLLQLDANYSLLDEYPDHDEED